MGIEVLAAAGIGSLLMGGYSAMEQKKSAKKAASLQEQQALETRRIAAEQKPMEEAATLLTSSKGNVLGNLGLAVEADYTKRKSSLGGTSSASSLGFGS